MFISTAAVILLLIYSFDKCFLETPSVSRLRNNSNVSVVCNIFYNMEYTWIQIIPSLLGLNKTDGYSWLQIFSLLFVINITHPTDPTWLVLTQMVEWLISGYLGQTGGGLG